MLTHDCSGSISRCPLCICLHARKRSACAHARAAVQDWVLPQIHARRLALPLLLLLQRGIPCAQLLQLGYELQQGGVVLCEAGCLRIQALVHRVMHALHRWRHCICTAITLRVQSSLMGIQQGVSCPWLLQLRKVVACEAGRLHIQP